MFSAAKQLGGVMLATTLVVGQIETFSASIESIPRIASKMYHNIIYPTIRLIGSLYYNCALKEFDAYWETMPNGSDSSPQLLFLEKEIIQIINETVGNGAIHFFSLQDHQLYRGELSVSIGEIQKIIKEACALQTLDDYNMQATLFYRDEDGSIQCFAMRFFRNQMRFHATLKTETTHVSLETIKTLTLWMLTIGEQLKIYSGTPRSI